MIKDYTYKIVGVTYKSPDGTNRQRSLNKLFNDAVQGIKLDPFNSYDPCYDAEIIPYEYDGKPALYVEVDGYNVGNIAADAVTDVLEIISKKDPTLEVEIFLNNHSYEDYFDMLEDRDLYEDELEEVKDDPIYSAIVHLYVDDGQPIPRPEPPQPTSRKIDKLERKLIKATEKAQRKEEKRRRKEEKRARK